MGAGMNPKSKRPFSVPSPSLRWSQSPPPFISFPSIHQLLWVSPATPGGHSVAIAPTGPYGPLPAARPGPAEELLLTGQQHLLYLSAPTGAPGHSVRVMVIARDSGCQAAPHCAQHRARYPREAEHPCAVEHGILSAASVSFLAPPPANRTSGSTSEGQRQGQPVVRQDPVHCPPQPWPRRPGCSIRSPGDAALAGSTPPSWCLYSWVLTPRQGKTLDQVMADIWGNPKLFHSIVFSWEESCAAWQGVGVFIFGNARK